MMSILKAADPDELARAFQLEPFDEFEEFHLKLGRPAERTWAINFISNDAP